MPRTAIYKLKNMFLRVKNALSNICLLNGHAVKSHVNCVASRLFSS